MKMTIEGVDLPRRKTKGSCGYDIHCPQDITIHRDEWVSLDLGILMEPGDIPEGCFAQILPRSSMGIKYKLRLANTGGIIDSDYTMDTIKAMITGYDPNSPEIHIGKNDRILQMILIPFRTIPNEEPPIEERRGGYGSTGV